MSTIFDVHLLSKKTSKMDEIWGRISHEIPREFLGDLGQFLDWWFRAHWAVERLLRSKHSICGHLHL